MGRRLVVSLLCRGSVVRAVGAWIPPHAAGDAISGLLGIIARAACSPPGAHRHNRTADDHAGICVVVELLDHDQQLMRAVVRGRQAADVYLAMDRYIDSGACGHRYFSLEAPFPVPGTHIHAV